MKLLNILNLSYLLFEKLNSHHFKDKLNYNTSSIYYCDLSLTSFTFVKLELRMQGTHFYGDAGEFDGRRGINLGIWSQ